MAYLNGKKILFSPQVHVNVIGGKPDGTPKMPFVEKTNLNIQTKSVDIKEY